MFLFFERYTCRDEANRWFEKMGSLLPFALISFYVIQMIIININYVEVTYVSYSSPMGDIQMLLFEGTCLAPLVFLNPTVFVWFVL